VVFSVLLLPTLALLPIGAAPTPAACGQISGPSTFDLYAPFLTSTVSTGAGTCPFSFKVRSINHEVFSVDISATATTPYLMPQIEQESVHLTEERSEVGLLLRVEVSPDIPEGTEGWIKVEGSRGSESHELFFQLKVRNTAPVLELGTREGRKQQDLLLSNGEPLQVNLSASSRGALCGSFPLSAEAPPGWSVTFKDLNGNSLKSVHVEGIRPYLEAASRVDFQAVVCPPPQFPKSPPAKVTFFLGEASTAVSIARRGMLWSANDMGGIYPHVHQLKAGSLTTYKLKLTNTTGSAALFAVWAKGVPSGWSATFSRSVMVLQAKESCDITLTLRSPANAPEGQAANLTITARGGNMSENVKLAARISSTPKVYYFAVDSLSYSYLTYNSAGTGPGREGDWLMPNLHSFMADSVTYDNASALLPSATDMNHTSALTGCYPGTEGIYCVSMTFNGTTPQDRMVIVPTSLDHARTNVNGSEVKVKRVFELAKEKNPEALCAFLSNKSWLVELHGDPSTQKAVERTVNSDRHPLYLQDVEKYVLGDPPSDRDPALDPLQKSMLVMLISHLVTEQTGGELWPAGEGIPKPLLNMFGISLELLDGINPLLAWLLLPANIGIGNNPSGFMSDGYFGKALVELIEQEDPDVTYCNLGEMDETGHTIGSAEDPNEWNTRGTAEGRDDQSRISNLALRDDAIDVARQADAEFGRFIETLKRRGTYESSIIVVLADHGMHNYKRPEMGYEVLDNRGLLRSRGFVMGTDYDYLVCAMDYDLVFSRDKTNLPAIESVLEDYTVQDPVEGTIHPLVVFNRQEMISGQDARSGTRVNPSEFFSAYWASRDQADAGSMKWPDLFVYVTHRYCSRIYADTATAGANALHIGSQVNLPSEMSFLMTGGHASLDTRHVPLILKAPGLSSGARVGQKVHLSDIAPTIYGMLGWETPPYVDGRPLPLP
jgi:arylsulfatase A-like enzyme